METQQFILWLRILAFFCRSSVCFHQLGSCAYLDSLMKNSCWLIQAFSMFCTIKGYNVRKCLLQMMIISKGGYRKKKNLVLIYTNYVSSVVSAVWAQAQN